MGTLWTTSQGGEGGCGVKVFFGEVGRREKKGAFCSHSLLRALGDKNPLGWMTAIRWPVAGCSLCADLRGGLATVSAFVPTELLITSANWAVNWSVVLIKYLPTLLRSPFPGIGDVQQFLPGLCDAYTLRQSGQGYFFHFWTFVPFSLLEIWTSLICDNVHIRLWGISDVRCLGWSN